MTGGFYPVYYGFDMTTIAKTGRKKWDEKIQATFYINLRLLDDLDAVRKAGAGRPRNTWIREVLEQYLATNPLPVKVTLAPPSDVPLAGATAVRVGSWW